MGVELKLPHNLEAERAVLGAILLENTALKSATVSLQAADFFLEDHRRIFAQMVGLAEQKRAIDLVTLSEALEGAGQLEAVGGAAYLSSLVDGVPRVSNVEHYVRIVREKAMLRSLVHTATKMEERALQSSEPVGDILAGAQRALSQLADRFRAGRNRTIATEDGAAIVRDLESFIAGYVVLPPGAALAVALWAIGTHLHDKLDSFPYLAVVSPTLRCGKTRLLEVLEYIVAAPRRLVGISEAACFRLIERESPTLLLDEQEFLSNRSERAEFLRGLLNAGARQGVRVVRCVGQQQQLGEFRVYCAKAFAAIGRLPDTLSDRSVLIPMQRRRPDESVRRFIFQEAKAEGETLRASIEGFVGTNEAALVEAYGRVQLSWLRDRAEESWRPLFGILAIAATSRLEELREVSVRFTEGQAAANADDSLPLRLLADIKRVWPAGQLALLTSELMARLKTLEDAPWACEVELTPRKVARFLRPFSIEPRSVRVGEKHGHGYLHDQVQSAFASYLDWEMGQAAPDAGRTAICDLGQNGSVPDEKSDKNPLQMPLVPLVPDSQQDWIACRGGRARPTPGLQIGTRQEPVAQPVSPREVAEVGERVGRPITAEEVPSQCRHSSNS